MRTFIASLSKLHFLLTAGVVDDDDIIWKLLRRFAILVFDFESTRRPLRDSTALALAETSACGRGCLSRGEASGAT